MEESKWILTDDDSQQYVRRLSKFEFELIEMRLSGRNPDEFEVYWTDIDVAEWFADEKNKELEMIIHSYGYEDISAIKQIYGESYLQVIAECIFECREACVVERLFTGSEKECVRFIKESVKIQNLILKAIDETPPTDFRNKT